MQHARVLKARNNRSNKQQTTNSISKPNGDAGNTATDRGGKNMINRDVISFAFFVSLFQVLMIVRRASRVFFLCGGNGEVME